MKFEWNPAKAESNYQKHGVSFEEAATVFNDALSFTFPDPTHSIAENRYVMIGMSRSGQLLIVAHTDRGEIVPRRNRSDYQRSPSNSIGKEVL